MKFPASGVPCELTKMRLCKMQLYRSGIHRQRRIWVIWKSVGVLSSSSGGVQILIPVSGPCLNFKEQANHQTTFAFALGVTPYLAARPDAIERKCTWV